MDLTWIHVLILITSGIIVGFINTLAGGGTIISLSVLMCFGLPSTVANGTNRVAVVIQNLTAVVNFQKQKLIDWKKGALLSIPVIIGSIGGAILANYIPASTFNYIFGIAALLFAVTLIYKPDKWMKEKEELLNRPLSFWTYCFFFFVGFYGGFVHVGMGYFILAGLVMGVGYELVKANAMKNLLVLAYAPFSLIVFIIAGNVVWTYGLVHSIGNIIGAYVASKFAIKKGGSFIRYIMLVVIIIVILQLFGVINPEVIARSFLNTR